MKSFPDIQNNIGEYVSDFVDFLDANLEGFFDFIFLVSSRIINGIEAGLNFLPW